MDGQAFVLVWRSPALSPGDQVVRIIHENGESINLDYTEILDEKGVSSLRNIMSPCV